MGSHGVPFAAMLPPYKCRGSRGIGHGHPVVVDPAPHNLVRAGRHVFIDQRSRPLTVDAINLDGHVPRLRDAVRDG
ncbi:MAG: hypothetical protein KAW67_03570, partial [Candidatus Eisenbacteria sp.]|nr:hypothetical protein [Candidatus Eisenbacteria bacterium]